MVIAVGEMELMGQIGSTICPSCWVYTNSIELGLRQVDMTGDDMVYPVAVFVSWVGSAPEAMEARAPFTNTSRVLKPAGTWADQIFRLGSLRDHPETRTAPL